MGTKPPANADYFGGSAGALAYLSSVGTAQLGTTVIQGGYLRTDLIKVKKIYVGGGTNEDIYFEDSEIRMYDAVNGYGAGSKVIKLKYSTTDFMLFYRNPTIDASSLGVYKSNGDWFFFQISTDAYLGTNTDKITVYVGGKNFHFYNTGQLRIPYVTNAPISNNYYGELIFDNDGAQGKLHVYTTQWRWIASNTGW